MLEKLKQKLDDFRFRRTVNISRQDIGKLAAVLTERDDEDPKQLVLSDGTAGEILNNRFETPYLDVSVTCSYSDASLFTVCVRNPSTDQWEVVLRADDWRRTFQAGEWQKLVKSLVRHFVA